MAVAIRGGTPSAVTDNGGSATIATTLTGTRQPQSGDVLVIIHGNDFYTLAAMPTPTVGGSTTGVTAITNGTADAGSNLAHVKSYTYVVGSTGDLAVSVTETGSHDEEKCLAVYVLSGVDTANPIDACQPTFTTTGATPWTLTAVSATSSDAFLIAHVNSGGGSSAGGSVTPPGTMTEVYDVTVGGIVAEGATQQLAASGSTGTRVFTPAAAGSFGALLIAVKTAAGGGGGSSWTYGYDVRIG